ncbi:MAG TPA: energy transducer TonB [Steroidobacteraceae bacterium]|nr:energy transducer TonB [Steroidobacteraceae bacterium]
MKHWTWALPAVLACSGCATRPPPVAPAPVVIRPVQVTTTFIAARVPRSARGEFAIVEVCVAPDGALSNLRIAQSSADQAFDVAALEWARQARYQPQLENGRPVYGCEQVRVEVNPNPTPHASGGGSDSALG